MSNNIHTIIFEGFGPVRYRALTKAQIRRIERDAARPPERWLASAKTPSEAQIVMASTPAEREGELLLRRALVAPNLNRPEAQAALEALAPHLPELIAAIRARSWHR